MYLIIIVHIYIYICVYNINIGNTTIQYWTVLKTDAHYNSPEGNYFTAVDLAIIGNQLDEDERQKMAEGIVFFITLSLLLLSKISYFR